MRMLFLGPKLDHLARQETHSSIECLISVQLLSAKISIHSSQSMRERSHDFKCEIRCLAHEKKKLLFGDGYNIAHACPRNSESEVSTTPFRRFIRLASIQFTKSQRSVGTSPSLSS
jgi:hypothetical protein